MSFFKQFVHEIVENLGLVFDNEKISVVSSFSPETAVYPLEKPIVTVGYSKISAYPGKTRFSGEDESGYYFNKRMDMDVDISIFVPNKSGGTECYEILWRIMDYFTFMQSGHRAKIIGASQIEKYPKLGALKLSCVVGVETAIDVYEQGDTEISEINIVRRDLIV